MPVQIIVGDRKLKTNQVEVKIRKTGERFDVELDKLTDKIKELWERTVLEVSSIVIRDFFNHIYIDYIEALCPMCLCGL